MSASDLKTLLGIIEGDHEFDRLAAPLEHRLCRQLADLKHANRLLTEENQLRCECQAALTQRQAAELGV
jgi:hypothetical protein